MFRMLASQSLTIAFLVIAAAAAAQDRGASSDFPVYFHPPCDLVRGHRGGTCKDAAYNAADPATVRLTAQASAIRAGCQPSGEATAYWYFTPNANQTGKVGIRIQSYSLSTPTLVASGNGIYGGGAAYALIYVKATGPGGSTSKLVRRKWCAAVDGFPQDCDNTPIEVPLVINLVEGETYAIKASLKALATHYAESSAQYTVWGWSQVEAEATINEIIMVPQGRPWISVEFGLRDRSSDANYDTWNAYEQLLLLTGRNYFNDHIAVTIYAGGDYNENLSYVDLVFDGDLITSWSSSPGLNGTVTGDSLRLELPPSSSLAWWGGKWVVDVDINPEIGDVAAVLCAIPYPMAPLFRDVNAMSTAAGFAGSDALDLYERDSWQVYLPGMGWTGLTSAIEVGWAWSVTNPDDVRLVGNEIPVDPSILLSTLLAAAGIDYNDPGVQKPWDEITVSGSCRGVSYTTVDQPVTFSQFPQGENSYTERRDWRVVGIVDDNAGQTDADTSFVHLQDDFDYYPRGWALSATGVAESTPSTPPALKQNYPNPFNPYTTIEFSIESRSRVQLDIFDVRGSRVRVLLDGVREPGVLHSVSWDGTDEQGDPLPTGVYFCRLTSGGAVDTRKMILLK